MEPASDAVAQHEDVPVSGAVRPVQPASHQSVGAIQQVDVANKGATCRSRRGDGEGRTGVPVASNPVDSVIETASAPLAAPSTARVGLRVSRAGSI